MVKQELCGIPRTVAYIVKRVEEKTKQNKKKFGSIYDENDLVICFEDGNPIEKQILKKDLKSL